MTSSVPEIVLSRAARPRDYPALRISVKMFRIRSWPVHQSLVLPGFYPRSEPAFDLGRPFCARSAAFPEYSMAWEIVRRTMIGR